MATKLFIGLIIFTILVSCSSNPGYKLPENQVRIAAFIKKYQDSISLAPDSTTKDLIFFRMWSKHVKFIQDTLNISYNTVDTFVFEKAIVEEVKDPVNGRKYLHYVLDNGNYATAAMCSVIGRELGVAGLDSMIKHLKPGPVKAVGTLKGLGLSGRNVDEGMKKVMLDFSVISVYNIN